MRKSQIPAADGIIRLAWMLSIKCQLLCDMSGIQKIGRIQEDKELTRKMRTFIYEKQITCFSCGAGSLPWYCHNGFRIKRRSTCRSQWTNFTVQKYGGSNNTSESVRAIKVIISGISNHLYEEVMNSCNGFSGTFSSALKNAVIHAQQDIFKNDSSQWIEIIRLSTAPHVREER